MTSRGWKITGAALLAVALGIQLVPVDRSNPPVQRTIDAPEDVERVLRRSCYDCHSNETDWPWYSRVAPASWLVADDVHEAREDMNFSEWPDDPDDATDLIEEIGEQVESGAMPLDSYLWLHPEARLSDEERQLLIDWSLSEGGLDRLPGELP